MGFDTNVTPGAWSPRGEAVVQHGRKRLLVWSGIPGERARVRVYHTGINQDLSRFLEAPDGAHPRRREPPCPRYTLCGGCPLMHLDVPGQHLARLAMVRDSLAMFGLASLTPSSVVPSPDGEEGYRHVVKLAMGYSDQGHIRIGARGRDGRTVVPIPECLVSTPTLREAMVQVAHRVLASELRPYEPEKRRGSLRYVILRQSRATQQILVVLVAGQPDRRLGPLAEQLIQEVANISGVHLHFNEHPGNAILKRDEVGAVPSLPLQGSALLEERLHDIRYQIGPGDFFQVNPAMAERMVTDVVDVFAEERERPVVDLYCGVGAMTLPLGRAHGWALGVEGVEGAARRGRENARLNHIPAEFISGQVAEVLPEVSTRLAGRSPVMVVDPARRGLEADVARQLLALMPARIAYLSCNHRTLARDLDNFRSVGWSVERLVAYDLFPQTAHLELLAVLTPPQAPPPPEKRAPQRRRVAPS